MTYLRAFHGVAQEGSVSRAAQAQGVSQPTISLQVRALEDTYGVKLLQKRGRGVELTRFGRDLMRVTSGLFTYVEAAEDLLTGGRDLTSGHLLIGATGPQQAIDLLTEFSEHHPAISLSLNVRESDALLSELREQRIDLAILPEPPRGDDYESIPLRVDPFVVCMAPDHAWAELKAVPFRQLVEEQLILRERGTASRDMIDDAFSEARLIPEQIMEVNDWSAILELVASGLGVSIMPEIEAGHSERVARIPLMQPGPVITEHLVYLSARRRLKTISAFLDLIKNEIAS